MKVIVQWSGGKDSEACLILAVNKYGSHNIIAVFCDTGWEGEETYKHVRLIPELLNVKLEIVKSNKYNGFVDLAKKKKRFPSTMARFCTEELKVKPMIDFILKQTENLIIFQGIRADESRSRSQMEKECRYFKYYFEPYGTDKKGKPKYHTYRKKDIIEWCSKYSDDIIRPIFDWTANETLNYIIGQGFPVNPLYYKGAKRVGCYPCIMCTKGEITNMINDDPRRIKEIKRAETTVNSSFFPPDYIPKRYCSQVDKNGIRYNNIDDVVRYINDKNATGDLFAEIEKEEKESSGRRCMSAYSICE